MAGECPAELDVADFAEEVWTNGGVEIGEGPGIAELEDIARIQDSNGFGISGGYINFVQAEWL